MLNKFKRTNFLKQDTAYDIPEYDLILNNWDLFEINNPVGFETVKAIDIQRPDMMSYRIYGDSQYWWILCKVNGIDDVWNDMSIGDDIIVPNARDINEFYSRVKKRFRA